LGLLGPGTFDPGKSAVRHEATVGSTFLRTAKKSPKGNAVVVAELLGVASRWIAESQSGRETFLGFAIEVGAIGKLEKKELEDLGE